MRPTIYIPSRLLSRLRISFNVTSYLTGTDPVEAEQARAMTAAAVNVSCGTIVDQVLYGRITRKRT